MNDSRILIIGSKGQLGLALQAQYPNAHTTDIDSLDITSESSVENYDWSKVDVILNAAAYTNVDNAESRDGRTAAWNVNAKAVSYLSRASIRNDVVIVHISTDYVFDGSNRNHLETELFSPLSVYGQSKAAGDIAAAINPKHYIIRTSWVVGEGANFVRTMANLARKDISPTVVHDQVGRLTFTSELVKAVDHLLTTNASYGTYNVSNDGDQSSWADIARVIFSYVGRQDLTVTNTTTSGYYKDKPGIAPRPLQSTMDLTKIQSTGFKSTDWKDALSKYLKEEEK